MEFTVAQVTNFAFRYRCARLDQIALEKLSLFLETGCTVSNTTELAVLQLLHLLELEVTGLTILKWFASLSRFPQKVNWITFRIIILLAFVHELLA